MCKIYCVIQNIVYDVTNRSSKPKIQHKLNRNHLLFSQVRIRTFLPSDNAIKPLNRILDLQNLRLVFHGEGTETVKDLEVQEQKRNEIRRYRQVFRGFFGGGRGFHLLLLPKKDFFCQSLDISTNHKYELYMKKKSFVLYQFYFKYSRLNKNTYLATTLLEREIHQCTKYSQQRQKEAQYQHQNQNVVGNFDSQHDDVFNGRAVTISQYVERCL